MPGGLIIDDRLRSHSCDIPSTQEQDDYAFHTTRVGEASSQVSSSEPDDTGQISSRTEFRVDYCSLCVSDASIAAREASPDSGTT